MKWQVSNSGGSFPRWRRDGKELLYRAIGTTAVMAVAVKSEGATFEASAPKEVFQTLQSRPRSTFDVSRDGQKFLVSRAIQAAAVPPLTLVVNWLPSKR